MRRPRASFPREWSTPVAGWLELSKSRDDPFRFVLKAGNANTILTSQMYASEASRETGINSVKSNDSSTTTKDLTR